MIQAFGSQLTPVPPSADHRTPQLSRYALATTLAGLLEACSTQNDNLIIPIFMWAMVSLLGV